MEIDIPIIVKTFNKHFEIKDELLNLLDNQKSALVNNGYDSITKTDWYIERGVSRNYWRFLYPKIHSLILDVCEEYFSFPKEITDNNIIVNYWFQQYHKNDTHNWHRHFFCSMSAVYFVELSEKNLSTEFKFSELTDTYKTNANEGDIIFFPSFLIHRSPINESESRKTIIAFNIA